MGVRGRARGEEGRGRTKKGERKERMEKARGELGSA